ncbi:MAG TPA: hypothetical protein G4O03_02010 [Dehalococcoidia bacterium]|nr:hypothetical protein [Dehalococcoidia bacterium]
MLTIEGAPPIIFREIAPREVHALANQVGKRYTCVKCGSEFIVTRGGNGQIQCCGEPMKMK